MFISRHLHNNSTISKTKAIIKLSNERPIQNMCQFKKGWKLKNSPIWKSSYVADAFWWFWSEITVLEPSWWWMVKVVWLVEAWNDFKQFLPWLMLSWKQYWKCDFQLENASENHFQMLCECCFGKAKFSSSWVLLTGPLKRQAKWDFRA